MSVVRVRYWRAGCPECDWSQLHQSIKAAIVDLSLHMEERHEGRMSEQNIECPECERTCSLVRSTQGRWLVEMHDNRAHDGFCPGSLFPHVVES